MSVSPTSVFSTSGGVLLFYITNGQNYCPFFAQCKVTINIITWAHCMFFADQVAQLLDVFPIRTVSINPNSSKSTIF
jgi:hypothetical protein